MWKKIYSLDLLSGENRSHKLLDFVLVIQTWLSSF